MKKTFLALVSLSVILANSALAEKYLKKPTTFTPNSLVKLGQYSSDEPSVVSTISESSGALVVNGSSFTVNGTALTKANPITLASSSTSSVVVKGDSQNQTLIVTLTRFALPNLKSGGGPQGNGALLLTLPAGIQILPGATFDTLKVIATNGTAAIKSNGAVLALGSVKAGGTIKVLSGTSTFQNILTGQQAQFNGRTLNVVTTTPYGTARGGVKSIYANYANGFPAVSNGRLLVNGTISIPVINLY